MKHFFMIICLSECLLKTEKRMLCMQKRKIRHEKINSKNRQMLIFMTEKYFFDKSSNKFKNKKKMASEKQKKPA